MSGLFAEIVDVYLAGEKTADKAQGRANLPHGKSLDANTGEDTQNGFAKKQAHKPADDSAEKRADNRQNNPYQCAKQVLSENGNPFHTHKNLKLHTKINRQN